MMIHIRENMQQKYRKFKRLTYWVFIGLDQEVMTVREYSQAARYEQIWHHKIVPRHLVYENPFGSIDVRQFKRTLNNSKYFKKKFMKGGQKK